MANPSNLTRRDQVYAYLKARLNQWIDGTELATKEIGGSEGLKRLRELRADLKIEGRFEIEMRPHPDKSRDIFQYRLTDVYPLEPNGPPPPPAQPTIVNPPIERREKPVRKASGLAYDEETGQYVAVYDGPPIVDEDKPPESPGQTDMGVPEAVGGKFTRKPDRIELGSALMCPKCKGLHRAIREKDPVTKKPIKGGTILGYEEQTRDPNKPSQVCPRCDGWGLIPNLA